MPKNQLDRTIDNPYSRRAAGGSVTVTSGGGGSTGVTDHGLLTGLADDDHTQYFNQTRGDARYLQSARTLTAGAGLTGGGDLSADRTFTVGAGLGITVNADDVALASSVAGNGLTYSSGVLAVGVSGLGLGVGADAVVLTSSADVGTTPAESILKSTAGGGLTLGGLGLKGNATLYSAGTVGTDNYASQLTGWRVDYAGAGDFRYLFVDELHAKSFIADLEQALAGGQIIAKSVAMLSRAFTLPAAGAAGTLYLRDLPSAENMAVFESGDIVRLRTFSRASGSLTIADAWGVVTSYSNLADKEQSWTFTRSSAPNAGTATGTIAADSLALDYGVSGNGLYEVNAIDGAYGANSPYLRFITWTTHPATGSAVAAQFGKLSGLAGIGSAGEYGLYVKGKNAGDYLLASPVQGVNLVAANGSIGITESGLSMVIPASATPVDSKSLTWRTTSVTGTVAAKIGAYSTGGASVLQLQAGSNYLFMTSSGYSDFNQTLYLASGGAHAIIKTNLGVGLTPDVDTPAARLHVHGDSATIRLSSDGTNETLTLGFYDANTTLKGRLVYAGGNASPYRFFGLINEGGDYLGFFSEAMRWSTVAGSERMRLDSTGLGIGGTPGTAEKLRVSAGSAAACIVKIDSSNTGYGPYISLAHGGTSGRTWEVRSSGTSDNLAGALEFIDRTAPGVRMSIKSDGNVNVSGKLIAGDLVAYTSRTPSSDSDGTFGEAGQIVWDQNYLYMHLGGTSNQWGRIAWTKNWSG